MPGSQRFKECEQVGKRETKDLELLQLVLEIHRQYKSMGLDSMYHFLKNQDMIQSFQAHRS